MAHLAGELTLDEAARAHGIATRQFARRQDSWFRKDPRIDWVDCDDPGPGGARRGRGAQDRSSATTA